MTRAALKRDGIRPAALGLCLLLSTGSSTFAESLDDVLLEHGLEATALPRGHAPERPITSYAALSDSARFAIAYHEENGSGALEAPLYVLGFDKTAGTWQGTIVDDETLGSGNHHCFGSAIAARASGRAIYITTHVNPSASCTLLFSLGLQFQAALDGWFLTSFPDGSVVYHESQIHFAPTHAAEISLYEPASGASRKIYPLKPYQPIREAHMRKLRAIYDDPVWCNRHNHHCDPELFDNSISGDVHVSDVTDSLAFIASFDNRELA